MSNVGTYLLEKLPETDNQKQQIKKVHLLEKG